MVYFCTCAHLAEEFYDDVEKTIGGDKNIMRALTGMPPLSSSID